jgi:cytochrome oxidase Cu insertion factor (SCO1/SenC/PrrC family)
MDVLMWNREPVGGPFTLVDHTDTQRTEADFRGKLLLLYFGFTFCPDVCPTDLQSIGLAIDQLGKLEKRYIRFSSRSTLIVTRHDT